MDLKTALSNLDPDLDGDWTADGLPRLDVVKQRTGDASLTRKAITDAAPGLTRATAGIVDDDAPAPTFEGDVLSMPLDKVLGDYALTKLAQEALREQHAEALREKQRIESEIEQLSHKGALLDRAEQLLVRRDPSLSATNPVQDYLRASAAARAKRAERARRFIEAGTTAEDVREQLASTSKLDRAMGTRKPGLGTARPSTRTPS